MRANGIDERAFEIQVISPEPRTGPIPQRTAGNRRTTREEKP
jgi:hypothetical protein